MDIQRIPSPPRSSTFLHLGRGSRARTHLRWKARREGQELKLTSDYCGAEVRALETEGDLEAGKTYTLQFDCEVQPRRNWALFLLGPDLGAVVDVLSVPQAIPPGEAPYNGSVRIRAKSKIAVKDLPLFGWWVVLQ